MVETLDTKSTELMYDAIVIGSGITGGMAAKELTEKGLRVLMIERGSDLSHPGEYTHEHAPNWTLPFGGLPDREMFAQDYAVQSTNYAFDESTRAHFIKDSDEPYVQDGNTNFTWIRGSRLGGRSLIWGRQVYRWGPQDFLANADDGHGVDWPIRYEDIKDWYAHVEKFIGVSGQAEGLESFPDMKFQTPMKMYPLEKKIKKRLARHASELTFTIGRVAILTEDLGDRAACHYCGPCPRGCSTGSYFSTQSSTLPAAMATGQLTVRTDSVVQKILYDPVHNRATGVQVMNVTSREKMTFNARIIFLCASAIHSAQILLNSTSEVFPNGLANSSGVVGRYLMDHNSQSESIGIFFENADQYYKGYRPNGTYIPRFRNLNGQDTDADFVRGYGFQCNMVRLDYRFMQHQKGIGAGYKDKIRKPGPWAMVMGSFGECLPNANNRVTIDPNKRDKFDMPIIHINIEWSHNERAMRKDMAKQGESILKAAGAAFVIPDDGAQKPIHAIHEMGTIRMGKDPKTSVLNGWNQSHDIPNLFVTDGSAMASSGYVNPSITYMALTARAADYAARLWKKGEL